MPGFLFGGRRWPSPAVLTQKYSGGGGKVEKLHCVQVDDKFKLLPGHRVRTQGATRAARHELPASGAQHAEDLAVDLDQRGNVRANTSDCNTLPNIFSAGEMRSGQSLAACLLKRLKR